MADLLKTPSSCTVYVKQGAPKTFSYENLQTVIKQLWPNIVAKKDDREAKQCEIKLAYCCNLTRKNDYLKAHGLDFVGVRGGGARSNRDIAEFIKLVGKYGKASEEQIAAIRYGPSENAKGATRKRKRANENDDGSPINEEGNNQDESGIDE